MTRISNILYDPRKFIFACVAILFLIPLALMASLGLKANALNINSARDCDDNAILRCGALTTSELMDKYQASGMGPVYARFGITADDMSQMSSTAVEGTVTNNNNVWINRSSGSCPSIDDSSLSAQTKQAIQNNPHLCLVATNAVTAGRQNISGSTQDSSGGITFFKRPPSVSFVSGSLPAFVVMTNGRFSFAIIASCGNPVTATPVAVAAPKPTPAPKPIPATTPAPSPTPQPTSPSTTTTTTTVNNNNTNSNTNNNSVVVQAPAPPTQTTSTTTQTAAPAAQTVVAASTPAPAQQVSSAPTALPNTGPGPLAAIGGLSTVFGTAGHLIYQRRKFK